MSIGTEFRSNSASENDVAEHLWQCDADFTPTLSSRVVIPDYAHKIASCAETLEAWSGDKLVGLVAAYLNAARGGTGFITSVSILRDWRDKGIAGQLIEQCILRARTAGMGTLSLQINGNNQAVLRLYARHRFKVTTTDNILTTMTLTLDSGEAP